MAMMSIVLTNCDKSGILGEKNGTKLSPPSWIQGTWTDGESGIELFKFTSDDVFYWKISLKTTYGWSVLGTGTTLKETKNNSSEYEVKVTAKVGGKEEGVGRFSFKKIDANRIQASINEDGDNITDWETLVKM
jgi:hypothetical protein